MRTISSLASSLALCAALLPLAAAAAEKPFDPAARAKLIAPFIDEQTVAVVHVDLSRIEVDPLVDMAAGLADVPKAELTAARTALGLVRSQVMAIGFTEFYLVVSVADLPEPGPFAVLPVADQSKPDLLKACLETAKLVFAHDQQVETVHGAMVIGAPATIERLKAMKPDARPELADAFKAAGDTAAQGLLLPPAYVFRVIDQLMPELPAEIGNGPSTILTRGLRWAAAGVDTPPQPAVRLVVQSEDAGAAAALHGKLQKTVQFLSGLGAVRENVPGFDQLAGVLMPKVEGDRLVLVLDQQNQGIAKLLAAVRPIMERWRQEAMRMQSANNLKQIGIAMHNWLEQHGSFPAQANYDADGRPLLSWRVHLLPNLGQEELYKKFHLDEPWDSEHNRALIDQMPVFYRSPASKLKEKGRASYLLPIGQQTMFPGREGLTPKQITDGLSNTIMAVEVDDEHAVIWTKPEDLPFDPKEPAKGLGGPYPGGFWALFCDASVRFIELPQPAEKLRAMFTRAAGDAAD